jgi:RES domain-containing protein
LPRPTLDQLVDSLGSVEFSATVFRHIAPHRGCTSGEGARQAGGRWNPPDSFPVIYTALSESTVVSEFQRLAARSGLPPASFVRRTLCLIDVELQGVLDLRSGDNLSRVGLSVEQLTSYSMRECQAVGEAAHRLNLEGILAPSATGTGEVLAVFELNLRADSRVSELERRAWSAPTWRPENGE